MHVISAVDLIPMDVGVVSTSDPYAKIQLTGKYSHRGEWSEDRRSEVEDLVEFKSMVRYIPCIYSLHIRYIRQRVTSPPLTSPFGPCPFHLLSPRFGITMTSWVNRYSSGCHVPAPYSE